MNIQEAKAQTDKGWCRIQGKTKDGTPMDTIGTTNKELMPESMRGKGEQSGDTEQGQQTTQFSFYAKNEDKWRSLIDGNITSVEPQAD